MTYNRAVPLSAIAETRVAEATRFADEIIAQDAGAWETTREQPLPQLRDAIACFAGLTVPTKLGGEGHSFSTLVRCYEELAARDLGFTCALAVHCAVTVAATKIPDTDLRAQSVAALMTGDMIGAFVLTEPDAGSDATAVHCRAERQDNRYRLNGRKAWVTNGTNAGFLLVFCQTEANAGAKGIAGFALQREQAGLVFSDPLQLIGSHAMGTTDLGLENVDVPPGRLAFPAGAGFAAAMSGINVARIGVAAMCNGALHGGLQTAIRYARSRQAFGRSVYDYQGIQFALAEVATQLEASRSLTFQAARQLDAGLDATLMAAHAKKFATRAAFQGLSVCMQALGANGLKDEYGISRQMSAARVCEFMDGTSEIQNLVIARAIGKAQLNDALSNSTKPSVLK